MKTKLLHSTLLPGLLAGKRGRVLAALVAVLFLHALSPGALGTVSVLIATWQPLCGLESGGISIREVTCVAYHGDSIGNAAITHISAANVPPTNLPEQAKVNLNLASLCHLHFNSSDLGVKEPQPSLTLDAVNFALPPKYALQDREAILRASLECLRRSLPEILHKTPLTLQCPAADRPWMEPIVKAFNTQDRTKVFYTPKS